MPLIVFVAGMTFSTAAAEEVYKPAVVPQCKMYSTPEGEVCGYIDIEDWKTVLRADAELIHLRVAEAKEKERTSNLSSQVESLRKQIDAYADSQSKLLSRNELLTGELIKLDRSYQDERVKPRIGAPVAWAVAGISLAALGGVLLAMVVD